MTNLTVFDFHSNQVRIVDIDGQPWFVAKDLCQVLEIANVSQSLSRLDDDEKNTITLNDGTPGNPLTTASIMQDIPGVVVEEKLIRPGKLAEL